MNKYVSRAPGEGYQAPYGPDAELIRDVEREINNVTLMIRGDNLHTKLAARIIEMVRNFDTSRKP